MLYVQMFPCIEHSYFQKRLGGADSVEGIYGMHNQFLCMNTLLGAGIIV